MAHKSKLYNFILGQGFIHDISMELVKISENLI